MDRRECHLVASQVGNFSFQSVSHFSLRALVFVFIGTLSPEGRREEGELNVQFAKKASELFVLLFCTHTGFVKCAYFSYYKKLSSSIQI